MKIRYISKVWGSGRFRPEEGVGAARRYLWFGALMLALTLVSLVACAQPSALPATETTAEPPPAVNPTAVPAELIAAVDAFETLRTALDEEWDLIREEFDQWSAGLNACLPNSMHQALNGFAIEFNGVTQQARNLTRSQTTGELADILIAAAEEEEAAYRQLRDRWQPNNVALFEGVETQRTNAAQAHSQAEDRAIELRETFEDSPDAETIEEFSLAFDKMKGDWQDLHDEYTELREDAESLEVQEVLDGLDELIKKLNAVIDALDELPHLAGTENTVDELLSAAKTERKELRTAAKPAKPASTSSSATTTDDAENGNGSSSSSSSGSGSSASSKTTATTKEETEATPELPDFTKADESVEAGETALKQAARTVRSIADVDVEESLGELATFNSEHRRLRSAWDDFHDDYNAWRENEGGCQRAEVIGELDRFSLQMSSISSDVRALPQTGFLLPMYTLMVDAAGREESAMRTLRFTWQPFTIDAFKALHEQRIVTDGLRREAAIGVEEIKTRF